MKRRFVQIDSALYLVAEDMLELIVRRVFECHILALLVDVQTAVI